jgi:hypothetical protein
VLRPLALLDRVALDVADALRMVSSSVRNTFQHFRAHGLGKEPSANR